MFSKQSTTEENSDSNKNPSAVPTIQRKLTIGAVNDPLEAEADAMADKVMRMPEQGVIQRKCEHCEEEEKAQRKPENTFAQMKSDTHGVSVSNDVANKINSSKGGGNPLTDSSKSLMEGYFGTDFSSVRVHADRESEQLSGELNAQAFTVGRDIYFNTNKYSPDTKEGKRLLAHELTHTIQQGSVQNGSAIQRTIGDGHDLTSPRVSGNALFEGLFDNEQVMELGDSGQEVRRLQQMLIDLGIPLPVSGANGQFTAETKTGVIEYQKRKGLTQDGRVGFRTIGALNADFPAFTLPATRTNPWTMSCILDILCPWNKNLVENVLPTFNIITFNSRRFPVQTWDGSTWVASTFTSGGFRSGRNMGFLNTTTCQEMAFVIYHEGWHGQQPSGLTGVVDLEKDAYINAEQWSIDMGIPGQGTFTNRATGSTESFRTTSGGETVVNEPAAETFVRQEYGGVSSIPGERVLSRVGADRVRVRRANGTEYERPAAVGESVRGAVVMTNQNAISSASWVCP